MGKPDTHRLLESMVTRKWITKKASNSWPEDISTSLQIKGWCQGLIEPLNYLSQVLDAVTKHLIEILDQHAVFQREPSLSSLFERADLPLQEGHFDMLDIVSYFSDKNGCQPLQNGQPTDEVNCVPHYDPGLLSISVLSTHEGLQLKSMKNNEWIDGPVESNIGVIWLGEAASRITQNRLKPGIHRVVYPQERKSSWSAANNRFTG